MEVLNDETLDRLEMYQIMASVFFRRLAHEEKTDALLEVVNILKGETDV